MCTGERTRELHSGPARAGGGLTRRESLATAQMRISFLSVMADTIRPSLRRGSAVLVRELVGFLPRLAEGGGPMDCCSSNRPLLSAPAQPCSAQKHRR